jgi:hypothetical protein
MSDFDVQHFGLNLIVSRYFSLISGAAAVQLARFEPLTLESQDTYWLGEGSYLTLTTVLEYPTHPNISKGI